MKYSVANPIYDSVFKFLMEDERIAKIVLAALLKKEVVSVEMRRHEYPNVTRDKISMFRIDFAARIKEPDGTVRQILIELQKTWLDTETLRFRRYLAAQYNAEENIIKEGEDKGFAVPMVAVYLLGHRVGDLDKAVVYVSRKAFDYDGKELENGMNDPFVNSLTHDSIIVQIPLLHGKINNKLDKVLSVFDQSHRDKENQQIVFLDPSQYEDDQDMMFILRRLSLATMSAEVRREMNDEDEFFSILEDRETQLMKQNKMLSDQKAQISDQKAQISDQKAQISEQKAQISDQKAQISEQKAQISEQKAQLSEQKTQLSDQKAQLSEKDAQIATLIKGMLQNGMSIETVAKMTGKSKEEIEKVQNL